MIDKYRVSELLIHLRSVVPERYMQLVDKTEALFKEFQSEEKLTIANETYLWQMWDPHCSHGIIGRPLVTEGWMSQMLGIDRVTLRGMYQDWLKKNEVECAHLQHEKEIRSTFVLKKRESIVDIPPEESAIV